MYLHYCRNHQKNLTSDGVIILMFLIVILQEVQMHQQELFLK